mgnify:CR=1 FL=1
MKLGKFILLLTLISSTLLADNGQLFLKMKDMRDAMHQISDGFFFNNKIGILKGINALEEANSIFDSYSSVKENLRDNEKHMSAISYNNALKMKQHITRMKNHVSKDEYNKASMMYTQIINDCTACHSIVRGW